jgi:hypothetical protein
MPHRLSSWLAAQPPQRRRLYSLLVAVILLTVPCYAAGIAMLALAPAPGADGSPAAVTTEAPAAASAIPAMPAATPVMREILSPPRTDVIRIESVTPAPPTATEPATGTPEYVVVTEPPTLAPTVDWSSPSPAPPTALATIAATEMPSVETTEPPATAAPTAVPTEPAPTPETPGP